MRFLLLPITFLCFVAFNPLQAQTEEDEAAIQALTENFMTAYNAQDEGAIQKMYTEDAVRFDTEGNKMEGADKIAAFFKEGFIKNNTTLTLKHTGLSWSDYEHAFVAMGTYEIKGASVVYDIKIHDKGTYVSSVIKDKAGEWKIAKTVLKADSTED